MTNDEDIKVGIEKLVKEADRFHDALIRSAARLIVAATNGDPLAIDRYCSDIARYRAKMAEARERVELIMSEPQRRTTER